jgi:CHAT domain-containing protein/tetratricopeptide (TPR) repeat protein
MDAPDTRHRAVTMARGRAASFPRDGPAMDRGTAGSGLSIEVLERRAAERARGAQPTSPPRFDLPQALALGERLTDLCRTDRRQAHALASVFVEIARVSGTEAQLAVARRCRANAARRLGRFRQALRDFDAAIRAFEREGMRVEIARTGIGMIDALMHLGNTSDAIRIAQRARRIFARVGDEQRVARVDVNLSNIYRQLERHGDALRRQQAAEQVFERHGASTDLALTRFNRANSLFALDRYREALGVYDASAAIWRERGMTASSCECGLGLGNALFRLGRWTEAWSALTRAHDDAVALEDRALLATAAHDIARVEILLNRSESALARLDFAISEFDALTMRADQADALVLRARAHRRLGRHVHAETDLADAAARFEALGRTPSRWLVELQRAQTFCDSGQLHDGRSLLRRCVHAFARYRMPGPEIEARLSLAEASIETRPSEAARHLSRVGRQTRAVGDPWLDYRLALVRGLLSAHEGRLREARADYERAYALTQRLRRGLPLEVQRARFMEDKHKLFEHALEATVSGPRSNLRLALLWSERAHVPALRDLRVREDHAAPGIPDEMRSIAASVSRAREDVYVLDEGERARRGRTQTTEGIRPLNTWRRKRAATVARLERLYHRLELRTAERLGRPAHREPDPLRIQAALRDDEVLLEYFVGDSSVHVMMARTGCIDHQRLKVAPDELHAMAFRLRRLWDRHQLGGGFEVRHGLALRRATIETLSGLHEALLAPLEHLESPRPRRLTIVPHRWLRGVPFHALHGPGGFLSSRFEVRYALSGSILADAPPRHRTRGAPLAVGLASPEAPLAAAEAEDVARLLQQPLCLSGPFATVGAVRRAWTDAPLIHLASHGFVHEADGRLSGIRLADGAWTVFDLYESATRADLVVLSACRSGEEVLWGGDDGAGLVPALFRSGARAAIVSLWPVDDAATRSTMVELHGHLAAGVPVGDALSRCWSHQARAGSSPYHWAPFILYGPDSQE